MITGAVGPVGSPRPTPKVNAFGRVMNGVEEAMAKRWAVVFDRPWDTFKHDDHFFDLGGDEAAAAALLDLIEDEWGVRLPDDQVALTPVLTELAGVAKVTSRLTFGLGAPPQWIARGEDARAVVFAEGAMGANNLGWQRLAQQLDPRIPILAVESIAYTSDGYPMTRVQDIAAAHIEVLRELVGERPVVLTGHSYGGLVAYEVACRLQQMGHPVAGILLLDTPASRKLGREPWTVRRFFAKVRLVARRYKKNTKSRIYVLGRRYVPRFRVMEGEPWVRWVIKAQGIAHRRYRPSRFDGDVTLVTVDSIGRDRDEALGWRRFVAGELTLLESTGLHEDMLRSGSAAETVRTINEPLLRLTEPAAVPRG